MFVRPRTSIASTFSGREQPTRGPLVCLALGTRGDVQPMAALASTVAALFPGSAVALVTHGAFADALREALRAEHVQLRLLESLPTARWGALDEVAPPALAEERLRAECAHACADASGLIFSLFALEGCVLAEALRIPSLAVSPYVIPYGPPNTFEERLSRAHPRLHAALRGAEAEWPSTAETSVAASSRPLSWHEVEHWMWPLFDEARWSHWRRSLGLGALPGLTPEGAVALPLCVHLAYLFPQQLVPRPAHWPPTVHAVGYLPELQPLVAAPAAAPPAASAAAAAAAAAAPGDRSARTMELQHAPLHTCLGAAAGRQCECDLEPWRGGRGGRRVYVTLGSAVMIGALVSKELLCALGRAVGLACARLDVRALFHLPCGCPHARALRHAAGELVHVLEADDLDVRALLRARHFRACVHHAGAGSTADALLSGTPAVSVPVQFDQFAWAARASALGCARELKLTSFVAAPSLAAGPSAEPLTAALAEALDEEGEMVAACARTAAMLGCAAACGTRALRCSRGGVQQQGGCAGGGGDEGGTTLPDVGCEELGRSGRRCGFHALVELLQAVLLGGPHKSADAQRCRAFMDAATVRPGPPAVTGEGEVGSSRLPPAQAEPQTWLVRQPTVSALRLLARAHAWRDETSAVGANGTAGGNAAVCRERRLHSDGESGGHKRARVEVEMPPHLSATDPSLDGRGSPCWLRLGSSGLRARVPDRAEGEHLAREIFERRVYEQHGVTLAPPAPRLIDGAGARSASPIVVRNGGAQLVVIDVGAHVGLFSLHALSQMSDARLVAIEPAACTCTLLRANLEANGLSARARVVCAAAGSRAGGPPVRLRFYPGCPSNSTRNVEERECAQAGAIAPWRLEGAVDEACVVTTVSQLLAEERAALEAASRLVMAPAAGGAHCEDERPASSSLRVRLLKVDVEGDELEVLRGIDAFDWPAIDQVAVEVHDVDDRLKLVVELLRGPVGGFAHVHVTRDDELAALGLDNCMVHAVRCLSETPPAPSVV